jgi:hypothetical protein
MKPPPHPLYIPPAISRRIDELTERETDRIARKLGQHGPQWRAWRVALYATLRKRAVKEWRASKNENQPTHTP